MDVLCGCFAGCLGGFEMRAEDPDAFLALQLTL
jgi:hypothetical protein